MMSKNLYFRLMKEDIQGRIWAFALIALGSFFMYPVTTAFMAGDIKYYADHARAVRLYTSQVLEYLGFGNGLTVFGVAVASLVCGMSSFSYLNSRSKVDFYHSLPVRREKLYLVNFVDGILLMAVPFLVNILLAAAVAVSNGVNIAAAGLLPLVFRTYLLHMAYFALLYATVVLAAMMTGHLVVGFLGAMVFWFYLPLVGSILESCFNAFFSTYWMLEIDVFSFLRECSPIGRYVAQAERESLWQAAQLFPALGALVGSVIIALAGCILYRKRPSEAAGKAMAFRASQPPIRIAISVLSGLALGLMFCKARESTGWLLFGAFFGSVISHCVIEIIYHFDFKKLFSNRLQLACCIAVSAAALLAFRYDIFGYDSYLPKAEETASAAVEINLMDGWVSYGQPEWNEEQKEYFISGSVSSQGEMECKDIDAVLEIAQAGIRQAQTEKEKPTVSYAIGDNVYLIEDSDTFEIEDSYLEEGDLESHSVIGGADGPTSVFLAGKIDEEEKEEEEIQEWSSVYICYNLSSGRKAYRRYMMNIAPLSKLVDRLLADPSYFKNTFPLMAQDVDKVAKVRYREQEEEFLSDLPSQEEKARLLSIYQQEFASLTVEQMREEFPIGLIQFTTQNYEDALEWARRTSDTGSYYGDKGYLDYWKELYYYPVYPSFSGTIEMLEKYGINPGTYEQEGRIGAITVRKYDSRHSDKLYTAEFSATGEIAQLRAVLKDEPRKYYAPFFLTEDIGVSAEYLDARRGKRDLLFPRGGVPDFVYERLEEAD